MSGKRVFFLPDGSWIVEEVFGDDMVIFGTGQSREEAEKDLEIVRKLVEEVGSGGQQGPAGQKE